ncbi:dynein axonemal intermediate chain 7-like isoform X1 [Aphidius gifuensis]|uniref:dynein axonemal intermediate chain 7-like isoform X1 n=1 Tax=Aphidius gifuensis TaxID=684658 RepID=UPI001CDD6539|nr:dynein axonemal intermediate chain 7-like isoform X1 [Aphidius gifuensis]
MYTDSLSTITFFRSYAETVKEKSQRLEERNALIKQLQEEIELEKYKTEKQCEIDEQQLTIRQLQLGKTINIINDNDRKYINFQIAKQEEDDWNDFMTCDGLPNPSFLPDLNSFMFIWEQEDDQASMINVATKCKVVTYLLTKLDDIIDFSIKNHQNYTNECKEIRLLYRKKIQYWIDLACYRLLLKIQDEMIREDLKNAKFIKQSNEIICCIWAFIKLPVSLKQATERDKKPIEVIFNEINLSLKLPVDLDCYATAIRGLWSEYDHYSDECLSYLIPQLSNNYYMIDNLLDFCNNEYEIKKNIQNQQIEGRKLRIEEKKIMVDNLINPVQIITTKIDKKNKNKKLNTNIGKIKKIEDNKIEPLPYLPTPDEIILQKEDENRKEIRRLLFTRCEKNEINLRKYRILGGVYHINLIYQPPQPKVMINGVSITTLELPKELKFVPFSRPYKAPPPAPDNERTPEIIEAEIKALEAAMEALILVTLELPKSVLWFEPPLVAHWISEKNVWSTKNIHDIKYNEEKQIITFRTGKLGIHGLAGFKFVNLPFQSWEIKPNNGKFEGVILNITAAIVQVDFIIKEDLVCLHSLIGGGTSALQDIIGKYMKLNVLIKKMRAGGCDLFPEKDAFSYVKGLPIKHQVTEQHLQYCMGLLSTAYCFSWSRWNITGTARQIIMQIKELHGCIAKERSTMMLLVTPLQTSLIQTTEVGSEFSDKPLDGEKNKFFADVYNLALHNAGIKSRLLMKQVSFKLATTVTKLLQATNVISMSS